MVCLVSAMQHHMQCRRQGCYACKLACHKTGEMHVVIVTAQERHCHASIEEAERCASPVDCWLMTPLPQEVVMGNLHDVAETASVATAGVAAACVVCVVAAVAAAAVKMPLQYAGMNAQCCMLKVIVYLTGGIQ